MNIDADKIELYLKGRLSEKERKEMEREMKNNRKLREEISLGELALEALDVLKEKRLREKLAAESMAISRRRNLRKKVILRRMGQAAVFLLLLVGALWLWGPFRQDPGSQFLEENYIPPASELLRAESPDNQMDQAIRSLQSGNYKTALNHLERVPQEDSALNVFSNVIAGHAYFKLGRYERAEEVLSETLAVMDDATQLQKAKKENVEWTLLLAKFARLQEDPSTQAERELLSSIEAFLENAEPSDTYFQNAQKLKEQLEK